jgi:adenylate kinase family enzyme
MILFFGPAGSGKTTQAELLAKQTGWLHVNAGNLLRTEAKTNPELAEILASGNLAPVSMTNSLMFKAIDADRGEHIILDGFPRNSEQCSALVEHYGVPKIYVAFLIELDEKAIYERLKLRGRADDLDMASIKQRLEIYHEETSVVMKHLKKQGVQFIKINGDQSIKKINQDIVSALAEN